MKNQGTPGCDLPTPVNFESKVNITTMANHHVRLIRNRFGCFLFSVDILVEFNNIV